MMQIYKLQKTFTAFFLAVLTMKKEISNENGRDMLYMRVMSVLMLKQEIHTRHVD